MRSVMLQGKFELIECELLNKCSRLVSGRAIHSVSQVLGTIPREVACRHSFGLLESTELLIRVLLGAAWALDKKQD